MRVDQGNHIERDPHGSRALLYYAFGLVWFGLVGFALLRGASVQLCRGRAVPREPGISLVGDRLMDYDLHMCLHCD